MEAVGVVCKIGLVKQVLATSPLTGETKVWLRVDREIALAKVF